MKKIFLLFIVIASLSSAQERIVVNHSSSVSNQSVGLKLSSLQAMISALSSEFSKKIAQVNEKVSFLENCNKENKLYTPDNKDADSNGCVAVDVRPEFEEIEKSISASWTNAASARNTKIDLGSTDDYVFCGLSKVDVYGHGCRYEGSKICEVIKVGNHWVLQAQGSSTGGDFAAGTCGAAHVGCSARCLKVK